MENTKRHLLRMNKKVNVKDILFILLCISTLFLTVIFKQEIKDGYEKSVGLVKYYNQNNADNYIKLKEEVVESDSNVEDSVYLLTLNSGGKFLLSADKKINNIYSKDYNLVKIHSNIFWNPNTCSRSPVLIVKNKVYFIESVLEKNENGSSFKSHLSVLDYVKAEYKRYNISDRKTTGYVYYNKLKDQIYLALTKNIGNNILLSIYSVDLDNKNLILDKSLSLNINRSGSFKKVDTELSVSTLEKDLSWSHKVLVNGNLMNTDSLRESKSFNKNNFFVSRINNSEAYLWQSMKNFDYLKIVKDDKVIFEIESDGVNKYVIAEIK